MMGSDSEGADSDRHTDSVMEMNDHSDDSMAAPDDSVRLPPTHCRCSPSPICCCRPASCQACAWLQCAGKTLPPVCLLHVCAHRDSSIVHQQHQCRLKPWGACHRLLALTATPTVTCPLPSSSWTPPCPPATPEWISWKSCTKLSHVRCGTQQPFAVGITDAITCPALHTHCCSSLSRSMTVSSCAGCCPENSSTGDQPAQHRIGPSTWRARPRWQEAARDSITAAARGTVQAH